MTESERRLVAQVRSGRWLRGMRVLRGVQLASAGVSLAAVLWFCAAYGRLALAGGRIEGADRLGVVIGAMTRGWGALAVFLASSTALVFAEMLYRYGLVIRRHVDEG
jgi:hypothetical protein